MKIPDQDLSPTPEHEKELTISQRRRKQESERQEAIDKLQDEIKIFADSCNDANQIRAVLRCLGRVNFTPSIAASIYAEPQEGLVKNLIQGDMREGAKACQSLLEKAFALVESLEDVNKILVCDYRIARLALKKNEVPDGSLLYGLGEEILKALQKNKTLRAEIIKAIQRTSDGNQAYDDFLYFIKTVEIRENLAPALLELQTEGYGSDVKAVVQRYA